jgi:hypothetical protein
VRVGTSRLSRNEAINLRHSSYPFGGGRSEAEWSNADKGKGSGIPVNPVSKHVGLAGTSSVPGFFPVAFDSWQLAGGGVSHGKYWS